ncbi:hypothetical protein NSQ89_14620 [Niallia sp. FSL R7-0648]|uniref:hypothetical protein n=1 Tax=Niallia sp. FSL R7-0648 TaxID=2954521 RepID=UPI0030FA242D
MYKKFSLMAFLLIVLSFPTFAHAATLNYEYFGTATGTASGFLNLNTNKFDPDEHFTDVTVVGEGKGRVEFYTVVNGTIDSSNPVASGSVPGTVQGARGAQWFKIFSEDGKELHATIAHSTAPHAETIIFGNGGYPDGSSGGEDSGSGGGGGDQTCTISNPCAVFQCPAWDDYMGKVDQIIDKIPKPPNWQNVSEIFRDTIAPRIKSDMSDLLGKAPSLPSVPSMPSGVDDRGIKAPEGKDGIGNSGFDSDDIKNGAPKIPVREDPTDGFIIKDPVAEIKDPPKLIPKEPENKAPVPEEPENKAPMPKDDGAKAPIPEQEDVSPPTPSDEEVNASVPDQGSVSPPTPKDSGANAPIPSDDGFKVPIPSAEEGSFPIPSGGDMKVPIPK